MAQRNYGGIFMMPTIGEQIGPELESLAKNIRNIVKPNYEIQSQLKQAIAQNPELLQRLIDMGPDQVGKIFGKEAAALGLGELSLEKQISNEVKDRFQADETFKTDIVAAKSGARRPDQITKDELTNKSLEAGIEGQKNQNRSTAVAANIAEETELEQIGLIKSNWEMTKQKIADIQQAVNAIPNIGSIDIGATARAIAAGRSVDPMVLMRLQQAQIDIGPFVNSIQENANRAAQLSIASLRNSDNDTKVNALAPLEKFADDAKGMVEQYNRVISDLQKPYQTAKLVLSGKTPKESAFYQQAQQTVRQYDEAVRGRDLKLQEYQQFNAKRVAILGSMYGTQQNTNAGGAGVKPPPIEEVVPPELVGLIERAKTFTPEERATALNELKTASPSMYDKAVPYINALDSIQAPKKEPAKTVTETKKTPESPKNLADTVARVRTKYDGRVGYPASNVSDMTLAIEVAAEVGVTLAEAMKAVKTFAESREGKNTPSKTPTRNTPISFNSK